jgi:death-on-curing protein
MTQLKGAALLHSIARNHALVDGNKRSAWLATVVFLDLFGHRPDVTRDAAFDLVMDVAEGKADVEEVANRLKILG